MTLAIVGIDECGVAARADGRVVLNVPAGGRERMIVLSAEDAVRLGTGLVNAGAAGMGDFTAIPRVENILLKPIDASGVAMLRIATKGHGGELLLSIDAKWMGALAELANGALEHATQAGNA